MSQPQQPQFDLKSMISAVAISLLIMVAWQYFYAGPAAKRAAEQQAAQQAVQAAAQSNAAATSGALTVKDVKEVLGATKRVAIESPALQGSINLTGARLDDLKLKQYHETVDPSSPLVTLLKPSGTENAYFVMEDFAKAEGSTAKLPGLDTQWQAPEGAVLSPDKPLTLTWDNGEGLKFTREISLSDDYLFTVHQTISNTGSAEVALLPRSIVQRQDTPASAGTYTFYEGPIGYQNGLQNQKYADLKKLFEKRDAADPASSIVKLQSTGGWIGFTDKYWSAVAIPDQKAETQNTYLYVNDASTSGRDVYQAGYYLAKPLVVPAGGSATYDDHVYAGAKVVKTINAIWDKYGIQHFDLMIDWGWYRPLTKGMFYLISFVHGLVGNFGVAILIVTVLVKLLLFPLANRSYASMSKMKKLKPQMDAIKEEYPDDRVKQQQETMELYKREKVNPMAGCLPMFIQIPIFFSLYKVILTTIELRHAPFFGWIHDLSAPDPSTIFNLFGLLPFQPPHALVLGFWPLLMGLTMWVQMKLNPSPPDPVQAQMFNWMPVIFTYTMAGFPAGLTIYWAWSNFLGILQQSYIMSRHGTEIDLFKNLPFFGKKAVT